MKKIVTCICLTLFIGAGYSFADAPCYDQISYDVHVAQVEYAADLATCDGYVSPLSSMCQEEALVKFNNAVNTAINEFYRCCCLNHLGCCG